MSERFMLITAGNPASGKDSYADHLVEKYGAVKIGMSNLLREYAAEKGVTLSCRRDFAAIHERLSDERGEYALADLILDRSESFICVNGLRKANYQDYLHDHGARTIAFWGSVATRHRYAMNDPARARVSVKEFWLDELPEYFNEDYTSVATVTVMNSAHYNVSIENRTKAEVQKVADEFILPELTGRGLA